MRPAPSGAANGQNPIGLVIPCHRVIGANGKHVGYGGGLAQGVAARPRGHGLPRIDRAIKIFRVTLLVGAGIFCQLAAERANVVLHDQRQLRAQEILAVEPRFRLVEGDVAFDEQGPGRLDKLGDFHIAAEPRVGERFTDGEPSLRIA